LGLLAPWLIFATLTFGNPIPGSIAAKSVTYRLAPLESLVRFIQHYSTPFFGHHLLGSNWQLVGLIIYLLLSTLGGLRAIRRRRCAWPLLAYPFVYLAVFSAANPLLFRWYLSPPLPFYILFILAGVWSLAGDIQGLVGRWLPSILNRRDAERVDGEAIGRSTDLPVGQIASLVLFTVAALTLTLNAWELHPDHGPDRPAPKMAWFKLELLYARAADAVLTVAEPGETLCAADIGTLGYLTDMRILDTVGLVTPEARRYYPADPEIYVTNYAIPADLVLAFDPDALVILEVYGRHELLVDATFRDQYRLLEWLDTDIYRSDGMLVFVRTRISN
jgi:hypothetical protein